MKEKKVKKLAKRQTEISISWVNVPEIGEYINPDIDYYGLGKTVTEDNQWDYFAMLCDNAAQQGFYKGILTDKQQIKISSDIELDNLYWETMQEVVFDHVAKVKASYD